MSCRDDRNYLFLANVLSYSSCSVTVENSWWRIWSLKYQFFKRYITNICSNFNDVQSALPYAAQLKTNGSRLIVAGFGPNANIDILGQLASGPEYRFSSQTYSGSQIIADAINRAICYWNMRYNKQKCFQWSLQFQTRNLSHAHYWVVLLNSLTERFSLVNSQSLLVNYRSNWFYQQIKKLCIIDRTISTYFECIDDVCSRWLFYRNIQMECDCFINKGCRHDYKKDSCHLFTYG